MNRKFRLSVAGFVAVVILVASNAGAQSKPDSLASLKAQADSISAVLGRALLQKDSARIVGSVSDTVGIVMPGNKAFSGREKLAHYLPLLFEKWGGARVEVTRNAIERVPGYTDMARQTGALALTRTDPNGKDDKWLGQYTVYWKFTDTSWTIERLFVATR